MMCDGKEYPSNFDELGTEMHPRLVSHVVEIESLNRDGYPNGVAGVNR